MSDLDGDDVSGVGGSDGEYDTDDDELDMLISLAELYGEEGRLDDALDAFKKAAEDKDDKCKELAEVDEGQEVQTKYTKLIWSADDPDHDLIVKLLARNGIAAATVDDEDMFSLRDMLERDRSHFAKRAARKRGTTGNKIHFRDAGRISRNQKASTSSPTPQPMKSGRASSRKAQPWRAKHPKTQ